MIKEVKRNQIGLYRKKNQSKKRLIERLANSMENLTMSLNYISEREFGTIKKQKIYNEIIQR